MGFNSAFKGLIEGGIFNSFCSECKRPYW